MVFQGELAKKYALRRVSGNLRDGVPTVRCRASSPRARSKDEVEFRVLCVRACVRVLYELSSKRPYNNEDKERRRQRDTGTMRPHKWMRKTSGSRFEGIDMFQPNEWTHGRARYASEARDCRKKNNKNRHRHADSWMLRRQDDTMIIAVSAKVLCYKRRVSLPINVEKRIPESPVSSEFEDTDILLLLTDGNPSKLILDM
ncbi:uncharacterized protein LOC105425899 isoform X2 [Pogonomyrmex barbatus]|uniref:Uncharacterized protein LOC105425899 isoform X2 n=1 Tax=Pogonomyrmex barbatus TaxID=144034 RepID=A0A6I9W520_9HYME|nr:uncharacterized protein LOC105425899 isoform X2 [Pogonomyrmex barbatus]